MFDMYEAICVVTSYWKFPATNIFEVEKQKTPNTPLSP